ncbi:MAG: ATP synthase F1 subunit gamma [Deltaproteobacteria bacterium CG07_land_8_20_14_0_80_38_7]|nr:MAG: ATP synthase F1 subunit gamma [Deltaproteobacteria bacterium CG07_land_8_20_14_0_80_38_7]
MQSLKAIKTRIQSVQNTQKLTKAMKFVAAAKLRRAQKGAIEARSCSKAIYDILGRVSDKCKLDPPALMKRPDDINNIDCLIITSDKGLCGGFNENLLHYVEEKINEHISHGINVNLFVYGEKGWSYLKARKYQVSKYDGDDNLSAVINYYSEILVNRFLSGKSDGAYIVFNRFISAGEQRPTGWNLLPVYWPNENAGKSIDYVYEPTQKDVLDKVIESVIDRSLMQSILESRASELAARMTAMDNATRNADEMISHLTLEYHKARQSSITMELLDIVGGAEALR